MQHPPNDWVKTGIVDVVNIRLGKFSISSLPTHEIPKNQKGKYSKTQSTPPIYERVSEKVVLDGVVIPGAHTKAHIEYRPLPELRGEVILLVRIRDKSIVGRHHSDIQMDKILPERRLVRSGITWWNYVTKSISGRHNLEGIDQE